MRKASYVLTLLLAAFVAAPASAKQNYFNKESDARKHCSGDQVTWLDMGAGFYYQKGQMPYGLTKKGAYICRADANRELPR